MEQCLADVRQLADRADFRQGAKYFGVHKLNPVSELGTVARQNYGGKLGPGALPIWV